MDNLPCRYCGSIDIVEEEQIFSDGTRHIRLTCGQCGRFQQYRKKVNNNEFTMPYGKHKGEKIIDIVHSDRKYAVWISENSHSHNLRDRFRECLNTTR